MTASIPAGDRTDSQGEARRAIVIGAGISGLASAALLAREGYDVTLLEKQGAVGGRAGVWRKDGFRFDTGPSWYLMPEVFDHFFKLMGTSAAEQLDLTRLDPGYRVFFEGEEATVDIRSDLESNLELFESIEPGAGVKMAGYLDSAAETYDLAKKYFLYSTFQDLKPLAVAPVVTRTPRLVRLLTETLASFAGRTVRDPRLQQILGYPAVFLGSSPYAAPSMYHLMSHLDLNDGVLYPQGGFGQVIASIEDIARDAGVEILTGADRHAHRARARPVAEGARARKSVYDYETTEFDTNVIDRDELRRMLEAEQDAPGSSTPAAAAATDVTTTDVVAGPPASDRSHVGGVHYVDDEGRAHELEAELVVATADLRHVETTMLLPELQTYPESYWEKKTAGPSAVLVYLGVSGELPAAGAPLAVLHEGLEGRLRQDLRSEPLRPFRSEGSHLGSRARIDLRLPPQRYRHDGRARRSREHLRPRADPGRPRHRPRRRGRPGGCPGREDRRRGDRADGRVGGQFPTSPTASWCGAPCGPADFVDDLNAWKGTALGPAHTLGQSAFFRAGNVSKKVDGLVYAGGSTIPGIGLPMCLISAELVIKRLRGDTSTGAPCRRSPAT